ncbi:MAG: MmgE/PrpD family protein [Alphaproteobacteria bacterium]|nr:MmgE/PrpD family protein [Alphaproteobacteria bacterium]
MAKTDRADLPETAIAEHWADWVRALAPETIPAAVRAVCADVALDIVGLTIGARGQDYMAASIAGWDSEGRATALGHARGLDAAGAAFVNGTAAHGEDFDDTFEGSPVHCGAVIVPAILAAAEAHRLSGARVLVGLAAGMEAMCRLTLATPTLIHRAGFHPTAVIGTIGAALGVSAALGLGRKQMVDALGVAGSFASGIIEYLAEGAWTKRLHAGWAAQSGYRAALLGRAGFLGPRTMFEGTHGLLHGFAHTGTPRPEILTDGLGTTWHCQRIAFKPYACGTMTQPFVDCARKLRAADVRAGEITDILCDTAEGIVHRLWEPLPEKHRPSTPYSGKFSVPWCVAMGFLDDDAGLAQFTAARIKDAAALALSAKVRYRVNPADPYPREYIAHIRATLADGRVLELHQPHMRGGTRERLSRAELGAKFAANCAFGGYGAERAAALQTLCDRLFELPDLAGLAAFRA